MAERRRTLFLTRNRLLLLLGLLALFVAVRSAWPAWFGRADLQADEQVVWFPTVGSLSADGSHWDLDIHGFVFEPERDDLVRDATVAALREGLGIQGALEQQVFERRVRCFLVDSERGKELRIRFGLRRFALPVSGADGHVEDRIRFPAGIAGPGPTLPFETVVPDGDRRRFGGEVFLVPPHGLSVVSDIDDTVKVSEVTDKRKLLRRTFLLPFEAVPGMAERYRRWAKERRAVFHFVSGSPWQLYPELAGFLEGAGFPKASFALRSVRFKDYSALQLLADPVAFKVGKIAPLVERFPGRQFVLVGDSGEKDPEVYGVIARRFPAQVLRIFIRDVTGEEPGAPRYGAAMRDVPREKWVVFRDPGVLQLPQ